MGIYLSRIEQDFVFHGIEYFDENENNYPFVNDARFASNYLTYQDDFLGGIPYFRVRKGTVIQVPPFERDNDLEYLKAEAERWKLLADSSKQFNDAIKQEVIKEARLDKKALDYELNVVGNPTLKGTFYYEAKVQRVYLRAGANYSFGKKYWEQTDPADFFFSFCGETIEFTEFSLIHILNRHFGENGKAYKSGKDYHTEDIIPWAMAKQVKEVMTQIDKTGLFAKQAKTLINMRYKGELYQFWAEEKTKSVKSKGQVTYKRVQSFYRVSDASILAVIVITSSDSSGFFYF